jgi:hypothetical protein
MAILAFSSHATTPGPCCEWEWGPEEDFLEEDEIEDDERAEKLLLLPNRDSPADDERSVEGTMMSSVGLF